MSASWPLFVVVFAVWCMWAIAASMQREADDTKKGIPKDRRGHVSILPVIPLNPLVMWGIAWLIDRATSPLGSLIVGAGHGVFAVFLMLSIARDWRYLRSIDQHK